MSNHVLSLVAIILGLISIVDYKNWSGDSNAFPMNTAYSVHSWLGIITVALFGIQIIFSIVLFGVMKWPEDKDSQKKKAEYKQVHHFIGHCMFAAGLAACATGAYLLVRVIVVHHRSYFGCRLLM